MSSSSLVSWSSSSRRISLRHDVGMYPLPKAECEFQCHCSVNIWTSTSVSFCLWEACCHSIYDPRMSSHLLSKNGNIIIYRIVFIMVASCLCILPNDYCIYEFDLKHWLGIRTYKIEPLFRFVIVQFHVYAHLMTITWRPKHIVGTTSVEIKFMGQYTVLIYTKYVFFRVLCDCGTSPPTLREEYKLLIQRLIFLYVIYRPKFYLKWSFEDDSVSVVR
jgi:hypothetical protein